MTAPDSQAPSKNLADFSGRLLLVGAGNMGRAMLTGWLDLGLDPRKVVVFEPLPTSQLNDLQAKGLQLNPKPAELSPVTVAVVAIKPQGAAEVLADIQPLRGAPLAVSIMAGRPLSFLAERLPGSALVRAMPNLPASIGRGITVAVANARVTAEQRDLAHCLLAATGAVEWVEDEALLDPVTAVSGSGPAYIFLLVETLARAGVAAGLPQELALRLARETVAGAGELLRRSPLDPARLRQDVTSPGGTTAAALDVLMASEGLAALMEKAIAAATRRSRELAR